MRVVLGESQANGLVSVCSAVETLKILLRLQLPLQGPTSSPQSIPVFEHEAHVGYRRPWDIFSFVSEFPDRLAESLNPAVCNMRRRTEKTRSQTEQIWKDLFIPQHILSEISKWGVCWGGWEVAAVAVSSILQLLVFYLFIYVCFTKSFGEASGCAGELGGEYIQYLSLSVFPPLAPFPPLIFYKL